MIRTLVPKGSFFAFLFSFYIIFVSPRLLLWLAPGGVWHPTHPSKIPLFLAGCGIALSAIGAWKQRPNIPDEMVKTSWKAVFLFVRLPLSAVLALAASWLAMIDPGVHTYLFLGILGVFFGHDLLTVYCMSQTRYGYAEILRLPYVCLAYSLFWGSFFVNPIHLTFADIHGLALVKLLGLVATFALFVLFPLQFPLLMTRTQEQKTLFTKVFVWVAPLLSFVCSLFW